MLPVLAIAQIIGIRPIGLRQGGIVFLDPTFHFGKQRFLQGSMVGEGVLAIAVFRLQVSADRRIKLLRIAHHLPPVRGFEPSVLIGEANAVEIPDKRLLLRPRLARRRYFVVDTQSSYTIAIVGPFDTETRPKSVRYCVEDSPSKRIPMSARAPFLSGARVLRRLVQRDKA